MNGSQIVNDTQSKIGKLLAADEQRDAIHIAVAPCVAGELLKRGMRVDVNGCGVANRAAGGGVGLVDPFLPGDVKTGDRFWVFLHPNTVTGMRHYWHHPAFGQEAQTFLPPGISASEKWIREYADRLGLTYSDLMAGADDWVRSQEKGGWGDYLVQGGLLEGVMTSDEFWPHYENVRNKQVDEKHKANFFSCSC
jgi:hypothetical protein